MDVGYAGRRELMASEIVMLWVVGTRATYTMSGPSSTDMEEDSFTSSTSRSIGGWASSKARDAVRGDRPPVAWNPSLTAKLGSNDLYDLVVNTSERSPEGCARDIAEIAAELWGDLSI